VTFASLTWLQRLQVGIETVSNQASTDFPGHWPGENHEWDIDYFKEVFLNSNNV